MAVTTTTNYGRAQVAWPDFAHEGGSALHTKLVNGIKKLSDNLICRYSGDQTVANAAFFDFTHDLDMAIEDLDIQIYEGDKRISVEDKTKGYAISQLSVNQIRIANQSGGSKTFYALVFGTKMDPGKLVGYAATSGNTPQTIVSYDIPADKSAFITAKVCGRKDGSTAGIFEIKAMVEDNGGTVTITQMEKTTQKDDPDWDVAVVAGSGVALLQVTGEAAVNIDWTAVLETTYV
jgi:hypothetical protein